MTAETMGRRERKVLEVRNRLLDAGRDLLTESGADSCTIEAVSETADVAVATFYNHFESKDAFLAEMVTSVRDDLTSDATRCFDRGELPHHGLALVARSRIESAIVDPRGAAFLLSLGDQRFVGTGAVEHLHRGALRRGVEMGIFTVDDVDTATVMFRGALRGACRLVTEGEAVLWKDVVYSALAMLGTPRDAITDAVTAASSVSLDWIQTQRR